MQYILLLLFTFLFTACTNSATPTSQTIQEDKAPAKRIVAVQEDETPVGLPKTEQTTDIDDITIAPENSIIGEYTLQRGLYSNESIHQELNEGYLVIEELDVDNYGYYYATIINGLAETHLGIFYKKDGNFVQKVIYNDEEGQSKVEIIDNLKIVLDKDILKININDTKNQKMIWKRDDGIATKSDKLEKSLKEAKNAYIDFYKNKCKTAQIQCAEHEFTPVDD